MRVLAMLFALAGCSGDKADDTSAAAGPVDPIAPTIGDLSRVDLDCTGAYELPEQFEGDDGLGHFGWELEDLTFKIAWNISNDFENDWLSFKTDTHPSVKVRPWLAPEAGACFEQRMSEAADSATIGATALYGASAFSHPDTAYDGLEHDAYVPPGYGLADSRDPLRGALSGLAALENTLPDAPAPSTWDEATESAVAAATGAWPDAANLALADLVLALGEATLLDAEALEDVDQDTALAIHEQFLDEDYATLYNAFFSPQGGTVLDDMLEIGEDVDLRRYGVAGQRVAAATEAALDVLQGVEPFDGGDLDLSTPAGRIVLRSSASDDTWAAGELEDVALLVDMGGDDLYDGRFAATSAFWQGASVVLDVEGDDVYGVSTPDVESEGERARDVFDAEYGFTQGSGLFGVGVLVDGGGADTYAASVYSQGTGDFGVGLLRDVGNENDTYRLGNAGQGQGYFGTGLLVDDGGDDFYGIYTMGQGVGRPMGQGTLLDLGGNDSYIAYYNEYDPYLPAPGYPNHYDLDSSWSYSESDGTPHYMSVAQGVGWGYRGDWFSTYRNWMGGFGALVDLGDGNDVHLADDMAMGLGYVYGFGFLYDGGGDDTYRTFWWGPAAAPHMGVGLLMEAGGDDDTWVAQFSGGWGYDCAVGWTIDLGGNDTYGGAYFYGQAYTYGLSFFINVDGDDRYNHDTFGTGARADPYYGIVVTGASGAKLAGVFMDLGGGEDEYNTGVAGVGNDATWYLEPTGSDVDPEIHIGIGIDE